MEAEAAALGLTMDTQTAKAAERFNDNVTRLTSGLHGLTVQGLGPSIDYMGEWTDAVADAIRQGTGLTGVINNLEAALNGLTKSKALNQITNQIGSIKDEIAGLNDGSWVDWFTTDSEKQAALDSAKQTLKDLYSERDKIIAQEVKATGTTEDHTKSLETLVSQLGKTEKAHKSTARAAKDNTKETQRQEDATLKLAARYGSTAAQAEVYRQKLSEVTAAMQSQGATAEEMAAAQTKDLRGGVREEGDGSGRRVGDDH